MSVAKVLEQLKPLQASGEISAWVKQEARGGDFRDLPDPVPDNIRTYLASRGIRQIYSHQSETYQLVRQGTDLVVVTPTASGKTLCYNLPVLQALMESEETRALYLFPTKALAQDQMAELLDWEKGLGASFKVSTYDGDTAADRRRVIRKKGRIVLTNPDMLHTGILPHHPRWVELFQNLRYVIVDELHTYRGVFGSHVANVFRRLRRVARFYNSELQFICASATIANPGELASHLLGSEVATVDRNGAPQAKKDLIFYNPPLVNPQLGLRKSALSATRRFAEKFLKAGVQTLVFASSRVNVEVLLKYLQEATNRHCGDPQKVRGYRGGYLPNTRRQIEKQLRNREILGVVSTNALELGIDIGSLEACVLAGYPGSIASTWQQMGRAGRRSGHSAAVLVARNLPLDQFIVGSPEYFLESSPEHGRIHPDNLQILVAHIKCAAFELPFQSGEDFGAEVLPEILNFLADQDMVSKVGDSFHWSSESYPANSVSLRNIAEENFVVFNLDDRNRAIAEVDFDSAPELIHEDAIYMCEGRQYHVETLDYDGRKAYVRPVDVEYYTDAITHSGLKVLGSDDNRESGLATVEYGEVHLTRKFPGFKKIRFYTGENLGFGKIHLPTHELHTTSYWFSAREQELNETGLNRSQLIRGFLGLSYAMQHLAALLLMCDVRDVGRSVGDRSTRWFALSRGDGLGFYSSGAEESASEAETLATFDPTIFLYDSFPGGVGFAEMLFREHENLLRKTAEVVQRCPCSQGCPSCVGPITQEGDAPKQYALSIVQLLQTRSEAVVQ